MGLVFREVDRCRRTAALQVDRARIALGFVSDKIHRN